MKKRVTYLLILGILLVVGTSFAYWMLNFSQTNSNVISSACFSISYTDQDDINLERAYPILDSEGATLTPYQFTITNNCATYGSYQVNLEVQIFIFMDKEFIFQIP